MIFFGRDFFTAQHPELLAAVRRQADTFAWDELITVADTPDAAVDFILAHDPDTDGRAEIERRRVHRVS
jgi:hypothetical protein